MATLQRRKNGNPTLPDLVIVNFPDEGVAKGRWMIYADDRQRGRRYRLQWHAINRLIDGDMGQ